MAITVNVNGRATMEGMLIAPADDGTTFPVTISLDGVAASSTATLRVDSAEADVALSADTLSAGDTVTLTANTAGGQKNDITLTVEVDGQVAATVAFTAVSNPRLRFMGRYQARFATNNDFYNEPRGTDQGWTWALEGEPDFVPATNNIPLQRDQAVGRVVRFHDPVALRSHVAPIGVFVTAVEGDTSSGIVQCTAGDSILGEKVSLGPNTYYASNQPSDPNQQQPFEHFGDGLEPLECFELHLGTRLSGKSKELTDRPQASGFDNLTAEEIQQYGIIPLDKFSEARRQVLLADYEKLSPADRTGTPAGRNLATRIGHLGGSAKFNIASTTPTLDAGWSGREIYEGKVNDAIAISAGDSQVLQFFAAHGAFAFKAKFFNFHSDELCARVDGTVSVLTAALLTRAPAAALPQLP